MQRISLFQSCLCLSLSLLFAELAIASEKPNVVVFMTDDQGWGDLSIHGNTNLSTPNIDRMARGGAQFENFYVCAVCAPTRAEFLTGRYYPRTGVSGVTEGQGRMNPDETTIADLFKMGGYTTGCFGKWHNGSQPPYHPNFRGFDEYYGFTSGHWNQYFDPTLELNGKEVKGKGFIIDDFTSQALNFIEQNKNKPFFCFLPYNTPHSPFYVKDSDYKKFENMDPVMRHRDPKKEDLEKTRAALAMCENIDFNVGRILKKLDELKLSWNTLVLYMTDNGPNSNRWNGQMKGKKGTIDEGGIRSPLFIYQPGTIEPSTIKTVTGAIDILPTLAELTDLNINTANAIDGQSFAPLLKGKDISWKDRLLFSTLFPRKGRPCQTSVRNQRFRLDVQDRLFDIENDRAQIKNVAKQFPEIVKSLKAAALAHNTEMNQAFESAKDRPFTVGYGPITKLTARDGQATGTITRSSKASNNSFFQNWTKTADTITWQIDVGATGNYEVVLRYTCAQENLGVVMKLSQNTGGATEVMITEAFDPPLDEKSRERVDPRKSHYFNKDFKPVSMGTIKLTKGESVLTLSANKIVGKEAIDVISVTLLKK